MHPLWKERQRPSTPPATDEQIVRSLQPHLLFHLTPDEKFAHVGPGGSVRRILWSWACLFEVFWPVALAKGAPFRLGLHVKKPGVADCVSESVPSFGRLVRGSAQK